VNTGIIQAGGAGSLSPLYPFFPIRFKRSAYPVSTNLDSRSGHVAGCLRKAFFSHRTKKICSSSVSLQMSLARIYVFVPGQAEWRMDGRGLPHIASGKHINFQESDE